MLDGFEDRRARAACVFDYYDGRNLRLFRGELSDVVSTEPRGDGGFDWDKVFTPDGYGDRTRAELTAEEDEQTYVTIKPFDKLQEFLIGTTLDI